MYIYLEDAKWVRQIYILFHSSFFKKKLFFNFQGNLFLKEIVITLGLRRETEM